MKIPLLLLLSVCLRPSSAQTNAVFDYRVLATSRTGTMEKEMNEAADAGFVFGGLMGGKEALVIMVKAPGTPEKARRYKFLATSRTGTMEKELQQAGEEGFEYRDITVYKNEVAVVLERSDGSNPGRIEYKLLATTRTGTMQKELQAAGEAGFRFRGLTFGGQVLSILERRTK